MSAQELRPLLAAGDPIPPGVGAYRSASQVFIDDAGSWAGVVETDDPDAARDVVLVRDGLASLREDDPLPTPALTFLDEFGRGALTGAGDLALLFQLRSFVLGPSDALYWNGFEAVNRQDAIQGPGFGPNTFWREMKAVKASSSGQVLVAGRVEDRDALGTLKDALVRYTLDARGQVLETEVLAAKGLPLPALDGLAVTSLQTGPHALALNAHGDWVAAIRSTLPSTTLVLNGDTVLAREGGPGPLPGSTWNANGFSLVPRLSINDLGDILYAGGLTDPGRPNSFYVIVKNGEVFAREGDVLPAFSTSPLGKGSASPLLVANSGDVYWFAQSQSGVEGFLRNFTPIVVPGVTKVAGDPVTDIVRADNGFAVSPDGRFWIGRVRTQSLGEVLVTADFGLVRPLPGCAGNEGRLLLTEGLALPGDHLLLAMDAGQDVGVLPVLSFSTQPSVPGSDCGLLNGFGEVLISPQHRVGRIYLPAWNGTPSTLDLAIPADPALVEATLYAQGVFWDVGDQSPEIDFRLTNGLEIEIGAP